MTEFSNLETLEARLMLSGALLDAGEDDIYEDNDDFWTAAEVSSGTVENLASYDTDVFMVQLEEGDLLIVTVPEGLKNFIYDPDHLCRAASEPDPSGQMCLWQAEKAGWHRIYVPDQQTRYSLSVDVRQSPLPPTSLQASDGEYSTKVSLSWSAEWDDTCYEVWRGETESIESAVLIENDVAEDHFDDTTASQGQGYYYWIRAKKGLYDKITVFSEFAGPEAGYATVDDACEENDSFDEAWPIDGSGFEGLMSYDPDYYRFYMNAGDVAQILTQGNVVFEVQNPAHGLCASSYSCDSGQEAWWQADAPGWYRTYVPLQNSDSYGIWAHVRPGIPAPRNLQASDGTHSTMISLTWEGAGQGAYYHVLRSTVNDLATAGVIAEVQNAISFNDVTVQQGVEYFYWVSVSRALSPDSTEKSGFSAAESGYAAVDDRNEENDTPADAVEIVAAEMTGLISQDPDYFRITMRVGDMLRARIREGLSFFIYDPSQKQVAASGIDGSEQCAECIAQESGTYLLYVPSQQKDYSLSTLVQPMGQYLGIAGATISVENDYAEAGAFDDGFSLSISAFGPEVTGLTVLTPWGEMFNSDEYLEANWWDDPSSKHRLVQGRCLDVSSSVEASGNRALTAAWYSRSPIDWGSGSEAVFQLAIITANGKWSGVVRMLASGLSPEQPTLVYPSYAQSEVELRPEFTWQKWESPGPGSEIRLACADAPADDGVQQVVLAPGACSYSFPRPLHAQCPSSVTLSFCSNESISTNGLEVRVRMESASSWRFVMKGYEENEVQNVLVLTEEGMHSVSYTDSDGTVVTIKLRGPGKATLVFDPSCAIGPSFDAGGIRLDGPAELESIRLDGTSVKTRLIVKAAGGEDDGASLVSIVGGSPLGKLYAPGIDLVGGGICLTGGSYIRSIELRDLTDGADVIMDADAAPRLSLRARRLGDDTVVHLASPLGRFKVDQWSGGALTAPSAGSIRIGGNRSGESAGYCGADFYLYGLDQAGFSLKSLRASGALDSGLATAGRIGAISALSWEDGWLFGTTARSISLRRQGRLSERAGNLAAAICFEGQDGRGVSLGKLLVGGVAHDTTVRTSGTIGSMGLGATSSVDFLAGMSVFVTRYAAKSTDLANPGATIRRIRIRGIAPSDAACADTNFSAPTLGTVRLSNVDFAGHRCRIRAFDAAGGREIRRVTCKDLLSGKRWSWPGPSSKIFSPPEDFIRVL